ncbi:uncharacterized protein LOC132621564 [Lycium barbarum]|uniref:uncharacterized protein LOC132621564 n=1 Tax=Lycium barbarum TaxID=112863 RepID=UPI00293F7768|nr:uncharacterized protein LOC132621564 [Lycium barbarum]
MEIITMSESSNTNVLSDLCNSNMDIGIKKFGVIDSYPLRTACKQKFSRQVAEEKSTEVCSIWQAAVEDAKWHPFRTITSNGEVRAQMIDKEDKKLQQLRKEWGYEVYLAVVIALTENEEYNMKGRTMTHQLWNFEEGRKATLKEAICLMGKKLEAKIKDTAFVKVDQLKPGTEGRNLIVKVLSTEVVVDKSQNTEQQSHSHVYYSQLRITRVAKSLVGDETGTIIFTSRNEQVDLVEPGSILLLYGAKIQMYRGFMRLAVEHRAQIIVAEPVEFVVNEDCNKSLDEYEVIPKY